MTHAASTLATLHIQDVTWKERSHLTYLEPMVEPALAATTMTTAASATAEACWPSSS